MLNLDGSAMNLIIMIIVGAVAGSLAARVIRGDNFGFVINAILGIAGAVVGTFIFNKLNINAGPGITDLLNQTFNVSLSKTTSDIIGMIVSATVGSIVILWIMSIFKGRRTSKR